MRPEEFTEKVLAFLGTMGITKVTKPKFYVELNLDAKGEPSMVYSSNRDTVFRLTIRPTAWDLTVSNPKKESSASFYADHPAWVPSDKLGLFKTKPRIDQIPQLLRAAEKKLGVSFPRVAYVRTNIAGGKKAAEAWVKTL